MKTPMLLLCLAAGMAIHPSSKGQTYAETKREQDNKAYNENNNNATRNQRNSNLGSGGGVDKKAAEELAEQFRRNKGTGSGNGNGETEAQAKAREQREQARRDKESNEYYSSREKLRNEYNNRLPAYLTKVKELAALGFTQWEAENLADHIVDFFNGDGKPFYYSSIQQRKDAQNAILARQRFLKEKDTMAIRSQLSLIYQFRFAPVTASREIQQLAVRNPKYKNQLVQFELECLPYCFDISRYELGDEFDARLTAERLKATDRFWELFSDYPAAAFASLRFYNSYRYYPLDTAYINQPGFTPAQQQRFKEIIVLAKVNYKVVDPYYKELVTQNKNPRYWQDKPLSYWVSTGKMLSATPADAIGNFAGKLTNVMKTMDEYNHCADLSATPVFKQVLEQLSNAGDASCMNAWALQLILDPKSGKGDRKKGYALLQQAIDSNSLWAQLNLLYCAQEKLKDAPAYETVAPAILNYFNNAGADVQLKAVNAVLFEYGAMIKKPAYTKLAWQWCSQSAAAGNAQAQQLLQWEGWKQVMKE